MTPAVSPTGKVIPWWSAGLAVALMVGALLRLAYPDDIEFKADEAWTFHHAAAAADSAPWPWRGMASSAGFPNPALSLWVFIGLDRLFGVTEPPDLARAVQVLNMIALVAMVCFALRTVGQTEREPWLWAAALAAVNPLAVILQRKIWPPSVLPLLSLLMLWAWWRRERPWAAFWWGFIGALLGQVHMAGFFFAAGFVAWAALFDQQRIAWRGWFAGSALGAILLVPWLHQLGSESPPPGMKAPRWDRAVSGAFWRRWAAEPMAWSVQYSLGSDFTEFLSGPYIVGRPSYGLAGLHVILGAAGAVVAISTGRRIWRERRRILELCVGRKSPTAFTIAAGMWGFGLLLTATLLPVYRHYLLVAFPLTFVWLARVVLTSGRAPWGRALLLVLIVTQALVSAGFLTYIHDNPRRIQGDYGTPYRALTLEELGRLRNLSEHCPP